jgi:hypothetical protein
LLLDCLTSGAAPNEAFIWRTTFAQVPHPLPGRAAGILLSLTGDPAAHRLLGDKYETDSLLAAANLPVPQLMGLLRKGESSDFNAPLWRRPELLFVKPRFGSAGRGAMSGDAFVRSVRRAGSSHPLPADLLIQLQLSAAPELADFVTEGRPPVLRVTIARHPGETPFLHSAFLAVDVPGEHPRDFVRGQIRFPVDTTTGRMGNGVWFQQPAVRFASLPWNRARLAGREITGFQEAVDIVLRATALIAPLAIVNWDLIVTASGPVILEGNTGGDWILTNLASVGEIGAVSLVPLLQRWGVRSE